MHRLIVDSDNRAGIGLLRIGTSVRGTSFLYDRVRPRVLVGLPDLRIRPNGILGSSRDLRRGARL